MAQNAILQSERESERVRLCDSCFSRSIHALVACTQFASKAGHHRWTTATTEMETADDERASEDLLMTITDRRRRLRRRQLR